MTKKFIVLAVVALGCTALLRAESDTTEYPQVRPGVTIFADYTDQPEPTGKDSDGNTIRQNSFNVTRAYVNLFGAISPILSARVTADLVRDTNTSDTVLSGSSVYRLKFAYGQVALDDLIGKGSWVRIGSQPTPYLDFLDAVYRYRFQGNLFLDREGYLPTADLGIAAHWSIPADYGDVCVGGFNGEGFNHNDPNDQKALEARVTIRPMPSMEIVRGLRLTGYAKLDNYQQNDPRDRFGGAVTFENPRLNAGFEYFGARDRSSDGVPELRARGGSVFVTPRTPIGLEGLFRYDWLRPDEGAPARKTRLISGIAYWFPVQKGVATAVLLDFERVHYARFSPARPTEERYAVHTLFTF